ncbi:fibronectin type III domain-containing protein [Aquipuribacter sp. SD81]|uniref:fibronectin type III domain-containing protein n=1 Tax=Aquipuribacter sp. SD81 TaxID=3127703 RepID=UPI00301A754F
MVVDIRRGPDGRSGTTGLLPPGWVDGTVPAPLSGTSAGTFAEGPDGALYEARIFGIYRHDRTAGLPPVLVAGSGPGGGRYPEPGEATDGPALGAPMHAAALTAGDGVLAYLDETALAPRELSVRVVDGGSVRTVADHADLTGDRSDSDCGTAALAVRGDDVVVACDHALRAFAVDGSDLGTGGRVLLGRHDLHRFGSPDGTPSARVGLPEGVHRLVHHPLDGDLAVVSAVDVRREVPTPSGPVVEVVADVRDAARGLGIEATYLRDRVQWTADLAPDGRVVAVLCGPQECWLRAQQPDGTWRTLAGGGAELPVAGAAGAATRLQPVEFLSTTRRQPMVVDRERGEVVLVTRVRGGQGARHAVVVVPLDGTPLRTPVLPGSGDVPDVDAWLQTGPLAVSPAGLVQLSAPSSAQRLRTVDTQRGLLTESATFLVGGASVAEADDGTLWSGQPTWSGRAAALDRYVVGTGRGAGGASADVLQRGGARADGALLPVPDGVLVAGQQVPGAVHLVDVSPLPPLAPPGVTAVAGDERATVSWQEADGEGLSVTGYTVTVEPGGRSLQTGPTARSAVVTGLTNGTAYRFVVTATNAAGPGAPSAPSPAVTPVDTTPPGPVRGLSSTPGWGSVALRWSPPADPDFAGVTVVTRPGRTAPSSPSDGRVVYRGSATQVTVTGLAQGGYHAVAVFPRDAVGNTGRRAVGVWHGSSVTSTATRRSAVYGQTVAVDAVARRTDGTALAGVPVELHVRKRGATGWTRVATATTSASGTARLQHRPSWHADYQVRVPGRGSVLGSGGPAHRVDVATAVSSALSRATAPRGGTVEVAGTVSPAHAGSTVHLERRVADGWRRVTSQTLSGTSGYRFQVRRTTAGSEAYRVVAPGDADHATGTSAVRTVRWT